jgi:hypothetical protein
VNKPQKKILFSSSEADMLIDNGNPEEQISACKMANFDRKTGYFTWSCVIQAHEPEDKPIRTKIKERLLFTANPDRTSKSGTVLTRIRDNQVELFVPCND